MYHHHHHHPTPVHEEQRTSNERTSDLEGNSIESKRNEGRFTENATRHTTTCNQHLHEVHRTARNDNQTHTNTRAHTNIHASK